LRATTLTKRDHNTTSRRTAVTGQQPKQALLDVLTEPLSACGYDLEDIEVSQAGRRSLVRVLVDTDGGVTLDAVAEATRLVSDLLDGHEVLDEQPYTLEVTSPGIDRPLTAERHWRRNIGRLVKVKLIAGDEFTGRITTATADSASVETAEGEQHVTYAGVTSARVEIEFNRPRSAAKE
jgi:ribosome maturation factor RimP